MGTSYNLAIMWASSEWRSEPNGNDLILPKIAQDRGSKRTMFWKFPASPFLYYMSKTTPH